MQNHWIISYIEIIQMTYSVHQHWDPLQVCAVGSSYPPEFYSYIENVKVRTQFEKIAQETEEDYQSLIKLLQSFNVEIVRTNQYNDFDNYLEIESGHRRYIHPYSMTPRDWCLMVGNTFYCVEKPQDQAQRIWKHVRGESWPEQYPGWNNIEPWIRQELQDVHNSDEGHFGRNKFRYGHEDILAQVESQGNSIISISNGEVSGATVTRIGRDLYHGTHEQDWQKPEKHAELLAERNQMFPEYRNHVVDVGGHSDGVFCPVKPGLIVSLHDIQQYNETFPDWEVVYLPGQSWDQVKPFLDHKHKVGGKWWVPGAEQNHEFTEYVESWMSHWVGYVEESVFDVNMLVIDEQNVVCNNENDTVFRAFEKHGITPHICNFRHRFFWDGGIHCITQDLHRLGEQKDYFPNRG